MSCTCNAFIDTAGHHKELILVWLGFWFLIAFFVGMYFKYRGVDEDS